MADAQTPRIAFVTGGTGFVGSHLAEQLIASDYDEVRCLVRSSPKWLEGLDVVPVRADLSTVDALWEGLEGVTHVYHLAGITRAQEWETFERVNVRGTMNLLGAIQHAAPDVERVLVTSSLAAVGEAVRGRPATEEDDLRPVSRYGRSKAEMEEQIRSPKRDGTAYADMLPITVVRPPAVYGPRDADILTFFQSVDRRICPVVGGKAREESISLVHARDLARGMIQCAEAPEAEGATYFLGGRGPYSWMQVKDAATAALGHGALTVPVPNPVVGVVGALAEWAGKLTGTYPPLNREKAREIQRACTMCSSEKAHREVGYEPQISLEEGVRETIAWYRERGWL